MSFPQVVDNFVGKSLKIPALTEFLAVFLWKTLWIVCKTRRFMPFCAHKTNDENS
jgi:hypothetical protein